MSVVVVNLAVRQKLDVWVINENEGLLAVLAEIDDVQSFMNEDVINPGRSFMNQQP